MNDPQVSKNRLLPPGPGNPRNSEGSFVALRDGRLLYVYSHFTGGGNDDSAAYLAGRLSADEGVTWGPDQVVLPPEGTLNTMSVSLLRLASGSIAMFYLARNTRVDGKQILSVRMRQSSDETASFSEPIECAFPPSYYVVNNDRVLQLTSGRLVVPASDHGTFDGHRFELGRALCFVSDDEGQSWQRGEYVPKPPPAAEICFQEPGLIELRDGRLLMLIRTAAGCQYQSWSADGGLTWAPAEPSTLISPLAPATMRRIPQTGDILVVYNDHSQISPELAGKRTPLVTRISRDEGQSWENPRVLEDDPGGWYCYIAAHFIGETLLLAYCAGQQATGGLNLTQITRLPVSWLYE